MIDLFSGAGGFTLGFVKQFGDCLDVVWANDFNVDAAKTCNANSGNPCTVADIVDLLEDKSFENPEADIVIWGPPYQGFSLLNKKRHKIPESNCGYNSWMLWSKVTQEYS